MLFGYWRPLPDLARDLTNNAAHAESMFDERVKSRFPVGSSGAELVVHLSQQGFETASSSKDERGMWHAATFGKRDGPSRPCGQCAGPRKPVSCKRCGEFTG